MTCKLHVHYRIKYQHGAFPFDQPLKNNILHNVKQFNVQYLTMVYDNVNFLCFIVTASVLS